MPAEYNLLNRGFKNTSQNGKITGFQLELLSGYYRGIYLPLIEGFEVTVNGEAFPRNLTRCSFGARAYSQDELEQQSETRWQWSEPAVLTVGRPGGLKPGLHEVQVVVKLRISYMPVQPTVFTFKARMPLVA